MILLSPMVFSSYSFSGVHVSVCMCESEYVCEHVCVCTCMCVLLCMHFSNLLILICST